MSDVARDVMVHGTVQGVFFRDSLHDVAKDAGVRGWVRNESDATVRAYLEGDAEAVQRVVDWMHDGPGHADVESVDVTDADVQGATGFDVR